MGGNPTQPITKVFETAKLFLKLGFFCILSTPFQEWSYQHLSRGMADLEFYHGSKNCNSNLVLQVVLLVPEEGFTLEKWIRIDILNAPCVTAWTSAVSESQLCFLPAPWPTSPWRLQDFWGSALRRTPGFCAQELLGSVRGVKSTLGALPAPPRTTVESYLGPRQCLACGRYSPNG